MRLDELLDDVPGRKDSLSTRVVAASPQLHAGETRQSSQLPGQPAGLRQAVLVNCRYNHLGPENLF